MRFASLIAVGAAAIASWSGPASAMFVHKASGGCASTALEMQEQMPRHHSLPAHFPNISRVGSHHTSRALRCLRLTNPSLQLQYPVDAEEHVEEIARVMRHWNQGFVGSRNVEDIWNTDFADMWFHRPDKSKRLSHFFGPYVPIFAQFLAPWLLRQHRYPEGFVTALRSVLRKKVPYVAVSQNADGLVGKGEFRMSEFPNVLVLSAGGYGHVALPLMKTQGSSPLEAEQVFDRTIEKQAKRRPVRGREYFVSFTGSLDHSPHHMRRVMKKMVEDFAESEDLHGRKVGFFYWENTTDEVWEPVMFNSRFSLVPRGYGRTAFHLVEAIHRGHIPIYIYLDQPWLPYPNLSKSYCYSTHISGLPRLLKVLNNMTDDEIMARESAIAAMARTHFTQAAIIRQMKAFLLGGPTDLVCQKLPKNVTDMGVPNWVGVGAE